MITQSNEEGLPYSLIISDIFLAGSETGLDLLESQSRTHGTSKFILVSVAEADKVNDTVAEWTKPNVVLTKPLNLPKCERAITQLLHRGAS